MESSEMYILQFWHSNNKNTFSLQKHSIILFIVYLVLFYYRDYLQFP